MLYLAKMEVYLHFKISTDSPLFFFLIVVNYSRYPFQLQNEILMKQSRLYQRVNEIRSVSSVYKII